MIVRLERRADREDSLEVERAAFGDGVEAQIAETVRDEPGSFAFVAEDGGAIVGHVQMSRAWIGTTGVLALGPIGVLPGRQRAGIGASLVRAALEGAEARGEPAVILLGDPVYYGRHGFVPASRFGLGNPYAGMQDGDLVVHDDDFQIVVFDEARAPTLMGEVRWHPAFG